MSEELIQRNLIKAPEKMGMWDFYNIGATTLRNLKAAKIILDRDYDAYENKKPDALVIKKPQVLVAIEYKQPKELRTKKQIERAISQELGTARILGAKIYIVTDGQKAFWVNPLTGCEIKAENGKPISLLFNKDDSECVRLITRIIASINATNDTIAASPIVDPLPLAQRVWQDLWSVSGATPENCLYTFVEIFIFKYLSDLGILTGSYSFGDLFSRYGKDNENEVIEIYANTVRPKIKEYFPQNPKDKTTIINGTIFISKDDKAVSGYAAVFKKILERFRDFGTLENIDYDFKSKLFETFLKESISKKNWGQFFTPLKVVRAIVRMADIRLGMKICDPACGVGKFLLEPIIQDLYRFVQVVNDKLIPQITLCGFDKGFDKDEQKTIILAKANMLIYLSNLIKEHSAITKQFAELFNHTFLLQTNSILGTLANPIVNEYDLILTNPPYVMSGSSNLKEEISKQAELKQHFSINAMGIEGLFMEWIVRALKPGGKAFVVVPDGIMNRSNDKRLRDFILEECVLDAVISLPLNTFFTTNKKTYIMVFTKKELVITDGIALKERQETPVFTYLCSEIGETRDMYRFDIEQNDLDSAATLFNMFKGEHAAIPIDDKRCKFFGIDEFYNGTHWSVERWWTREEKIDLGIEGEIDVASLDDFSSLIGNVSDILLEYQELISEMQKKNLKFSETERSVKRVKVNDVFSVVRGNGKYTKTYAQNHQGEYPLYSGNTSRAFAIIDTFDYSEPCLSWAIDGLAGYIMCHNSPFSATNHRGVLLPKLKDIDMRYVKYILEPLFRDTKKGRLGERGENEYTSLPPFMIANIEFDIPVNESGDFDLAIQEAIAEQFAIVSELKSEMKTNHSKIDNIVISIDLNAYTMENFSLTQLLEPVKGKSKYTRKYGDSHKGNYPVFSASLNTPLTYIDTFDFNGSFLTWSTNGFAGTVTILEGKFSVNGDRGLLLPKSDKIDIQYLKYTLEPIFRKLAKGRKGEHGKDEFTKLYPSMINDIQIPLPVDESGNISLSAQCEISEKYATIAHYKVKILEKLESLISQHITH
jgi:type I restriction-modification system DNA methylase subunit